MKISLPLAVLLVIGMIGIVVADTGVPETIETQGFTTTTSVTALGTTTENDAMVWLETNDAVGDQYGGLDNQPPLYYYGVERYTSSYSEDTIADQGLTSYEKRMAVDTAKKEANQFNVEAQKIVSFVAEDTGRMTSEEDILLDGAGTETPDEVILLCPFGSDGYSWNPAFCNVVLMGSRVDLTEGALATDTEERHVMPAVSPDSSWPDPISDAGVETNYDIVLSGVTPGSLAAGSATASIDVHIQEGRLGIPVIVDDWPFPTKSGDLSYSETTTASGGIALFQKSMSYESKITSPGFSYFF